MAIHYRASQPEAAALADQLNNARHDSAMTVAADLLDVAALAPLVAGVVKHFGRLDALVNNASLPTRRQLAMSRCTTGEALIGSNLRAPLFLAQGSRAASEGERWQHCQHHRHPHRATGCRITSSTTSLKAGLRGLTHQRWPAIWHRKFANAVAPGPDRLARMTARLPPPSAANTVPGPAQRRRRCADCRGREVPICDADFVTGHTINVDGGRNIAL